jgi:hypothetical protein
MTYFSLEMVAAPLAAVATWLGWQARSASPPMIEATVRPTPAASLPAETAPAAAEAAPAAVGGVHPDYSYDYNSGCMAGVMAAMRAF